MSPWKKDHFNDGFVTWDNEVIALSFPLLWGSDFYLSNRLTRAVLHRCFSCLTLQDKYSHTYLIVITVSLTSYVSRLPLCSSLFSFLSLPPTFSESRKKQGASLSGPFPAAPHVVQQLGAEEVVKMPAELTDTRTKQAGTHTHCVHPDFQWRHQRHLYVREGRTEEDRVRSWCVNALIAKHSGSFR